jgi:hypothetical protein
MGVAVNNPGSNRDNCPKISTACVIWQGPNIPCINLCAGDAIDEVVFKLATYLCELSENIFDINNIEFACLLPPDAQREDTPTNLEELIQLIINYVCNGSVTPLLAARTVGVTSSNEPIIELPDGIAYFDENGDYITVLEQSKYIKVAATKLAETIVLINTTQGRIFNAEKAIKNLENQFAKTSKASTNDIYVVSQCASSGTPGQQILIQDAFTVFERNYCNLTSVIGTTTALYNGINSQIPNLPNLPQLMNGSLQMKAIPRWSTSVNNIGSSLTNLWLTVSDMRSKIIEIANNTFDIPCVLLSPENLKMGTIATTSADVYWEKPSTADVQSPGSYSIEIYSIEDTEFKAPLYSTTYSQIQDKPNVLNILTEQFEFDVDYVLHVSSIYKCGMSKPLSLTTKLKISDIYYQLIPEIVTETNGTGTCIDSREESQQYDIVNTSINFKLVIKENGEEVSNRGKAPINIIGRFRIESCEYGDEPVYEDVSFTIDIKNSKSDVKTFVSEKLTNCNDGTCGSYSKSYFCGVFVSEATIEFDSKYGSCN